MLFRKFFDRLTRSTPVASFGFFRKDLASLLASADSAGTLDARIQWMEDLVEWIRLSSAPENGGKGAGMIQAVRVRFFLQTLEKNPAWRASVSKLLISLLLETDPVSLLSQTGLHNEDGFFGAALERTLHRVLPAPRDEHDLAELFSRIFAEESDADWLASLDEATLTSLLALVIPDYTQREVLGRRFLGAMKEALVILSARVESAGLSAEIRLRSHIKSVSQSAFYRLRLVLTDALEGRTQPDPGHFQPLFSLCREEINSSFRHLEEHGVSVAIVYRLEKMERQLSRMEALVSILFAPADSQRSGAWLSLLADLVRSRLENESLRTLVQHNLHMLSRKIVERTGASGEHYITSTPREWFAMLSSAAGGGVLTAGTALLKTLIGKTNPALFFEGFFSWLNYSGSFLLMQAFHFTLATKQPSMTAPALAAKLKEAQGAGEFTELVARLTRSQFAAALGNIGAAVPTAFLVDYIFFLSSGSHLFSAEYAAKTVHNLHLWKSPVLAYAALTGIILWISSIGAGWIENFFVYRRLPEAMQQSPWIQRLLGADRARRFCNWVFHNISGIGGSVVLGFLLAFTPVAGQFFGLPLNVAHVTLSTASLTFSFCALPNATAADIAIGAASIVLIGVLNFGVSFAAALFTALKARDVRSERLARVRAALSLRFRREPLSFLLPVAKNK